MFIFLCGLFIWGYQRYFNPYITDAQKTGYIMSVEKRGLFFKTYEGSMLSETALEDTNKVYQRDFSFSFENDSIAKEVMKMQDTGKKITLHYKQYYGVLPWRGSSRSIITDVN